ncbi:UNVERIFIED_CONTAM: hypothetical protein HDU68_011932 [Siphonaria sp. JEL0065]|nr:hypothetical protein HDU68_011932 [Siphonaria sp. JEL0065]
MQEQTSTYLKLPVGKSSVFKQQLSGLNAYEKHLKFVNDYVKFYESGSTQQPQHSAQLVSEVDILKRNHQFLRDDQETLDNSDSSWEHRIAKKYYDKLFKEFAITDLSRYMEGKVALRWRTKREVVSGIGQFTCANLKCSHREAYMPSASSASISTPASTSTSTYPRVNHQTTNHQHASNRRHQNHQPDLRSWEVNFAYKEGGIYKNALVKLRLCPDCSYKLNYKKIKEKEAAAAELREQEERKRKRKEKKRKRRQEEGRDNDDLNGNEKKEKKRKKHRRSSSVSSSNFGDSDDEREKDQDECSNDSDAAAETKQVAPENLASQIWGAPQTLENEKSKDEEMDDFFNDIFDE